MLTQVKLGANSIHSWCALELYISGSFIYRFEYVPYDVPKSIEARIKFRYTDHRIRCIPTTISIQKALIGVELRYGSPIQAFLTQKIQKSLDLVVGYRIYVTDNDIAYPKKS